MCEAKQVTIKDVLFTLKNKAIELVQSIGFKRDIPTCKRIQEVEDCARIAYTRTFRAERAAVDGGYAFDEPVYEFQSRCTSLLMALHRLTKECIISVRTDDVLEIQVTVAAGTAIEVNRLNRMFLHPYTKLSHKRIKIGK